MSAATRKTKRTSTKREKKRAPVGKDGSAKNKRGQGAPGERTSDNKPRSATAGRSMAAAGDKQAGKTKRGATSPKKSTQKRKKKASAASARAPQRPRRAPDKPDQAQPDDRNERDAFPVVGIGASAGGLEALQEFFAHVPADTNCAFVVVTHMHRDHRSMLPELLDRSTSLPVEEAADGQSVEPNRVYVTPPGDHLTIEEGRLVRRDVESEIRLPIDYFLRGLAADQKDSAICIILSGTGTDGTLGLRAVKAEAGMAMVQQPQSAKFAGMPASAEQTGLADYVLRPADMPSQLVAYVRELRERIRVPMRLAPEFPHDVWQNILSTLRMRTGNDFSAYKASTIRRRIERRMNVHQIQAPQDYARYLKEHRHEANLLHRDLLITVTSFFRDASAFDALRDTLSEDLRRLEGGQEYRVWVPGCATGEEAYSVGIVLHDCLSRLERPITMQVFATDLDERAIDTARTGVYASGIAADVPERYLEHYFTRDDDNYRINKEIRESVVFAPHNVLTDPPFTRLNMIVCRNVLIYFESRLQKDLLPTFHYALRRGGLLFLGPSETVGPLDSLFDVVDRKWKIYRRRDTVEPVHPPMLAGPSHGEPTREPAGPGPTGTEGLPRDRGTEGRLQRALLSRFAPTCLVVEDNGDLVYIHGRTGLYLEPSEGKPRHNALEMARAGLENPLRTALRRAAQQRTEIRRRNLSVKTNSEYTAVDITVVPVEQPESLRGLFIVALRPSTELAPAKRKKARKQPKGAGDDTRVAELEDELRHSQESLQSTVEELESSNEELKSTNEELQSMNEELQSSNEELETSKEEMQSLNEELTTVNAELHSKIDELSHANDDMQNLLDGLDVASVFLDDQLRIKRYTEQARELIHLVPSDIDRPLDDLALHIDYQRLVDDCRHVLRTLERREEQIRSANGTWLMMRILPYRTSANVIEGVVVTFVPIDQLKRAEERARHAWDYFEGIVETVREPLVVLAANLTVRSANRAFYNTFQVAPEQVEGRRIYDLGDGQWGIPRLRKLLEEILARDTSFYDYEVEHDFPHIGRRRFVLNARRLEVGADDDDHILLAIEEETGTGS